MSDVAGAPAAPIPGVAADTGGVQIPAPVAPAPVEPAPVVPEPVHFREGLAEDLRVSPALQDVKDVDSLARQFIDLQKYQGDSIRIPSENADQQAVTDFHTKLKSRIPGLMDTPDPNNPEMMNRVYDSLGRPEDASKYNRPQFEEGFQVDETRDKAFSEVGYDIGLSDRQFQQLYAWDAAFQTEQAKVMDQEVEASVGELKNEWGYTFEPRMAAIAQITEQFGFAPEVVQAARDHKLGKSFSNAMYNIVKQLGGEGEINKQGDQAQANVMTPDEANRQIQEIQQREEYRHHDASVRQPWIDKVQELMKFAAPDALRGSAAVDNLRRGGMG